MTGVQGSLYAETRGERKQGGGRGGLGSHEDGTGVAWALGDQDSECEEDVAETSDGRRETAEVSGNGGGQSGTDRWKVQVGL